MDAKKGQLSCLLRAKNRAGRENTGICLHLPSGCSKMTTHVYEYVRSIVRLDNEFCYFAPVK